MATTFLTLVNDTLRRFNEVVISSTDFPTVTGFRSHVKDGVNAALHDISQREYFFPFNHTSGSLTLVTGTKTYALASDVKLADWNTFRINYDAGNNFSARKLKQLNYDVYLQSYFERDSTAGTGDYDQPTLVYRTPDNQAGFTPVTDNTYSVSYDYYAYNTDLALHGDTMTVPDAFKNVVVDGAVYYGYMFRDNSQQAVIAKDVFNKGIDHMRSILINRYTEIRDTRTSRIIRAPSSHP
tara:strand:+ start:3041 stop:3757 length:717 start_codon:yes stop_codon:yes gene_type:complete